jgi:hypothetical protein
VQAIGSPSVRDSSQHAQLSTIKAVAPQSARIEQPARLQLVNGSYTLVSSEAPNAAPSAKAAGSPNVQQHKAKPFRFPAAQPRRKAAKLTPQQAQQPGGGKTPTTAEHVRSAVQLEPEVQPIGTIAELSAAELSEDRQQQSDQAVLKAPAECAAEPATQPTSPQRRALVALSATVVEELPQDPPTDRHPEGAPHIQHHAQSAAAQPAAAPESAGAAPVPTDKQHLATDSTGAAAGAAAESPATPGPSEPASATAAAASASSLPECLATSASVLPPCVTAAAAASGPPRKQRRAGRNGPAACAAKGQTKVPADAQHRLTSVRGASSTLPRSPVLAHEAEHVVYSGPPAEAGKEGKTAEAADTGTAGAGHATTACSLSRIGSRTDIAQPEPALMPQTPPLMPEVAASRHDDHTSSNAAVSNASSVHGCSTDPADTDTDSQDSPNAAPAQEQVDKVRCSLLPVPACYTGP